MSTSRKPVPPQILSVIAARKQAMDASQAGMFTTSELCRILSVTKQTISTRAKDGSIPHFRLGTLLRFDPEQIASWLTARSV